eukprot:CAMPEP_0182947772 /NCGR_PEP_ID=MMETSP0105_2-20130417/59145_1 /TAXON_ID=81532 ORGANISM="Acanthoeca-like sp., Strain 10tr" /NCGR_SAMPLE_ID=MMETSP0105_2 /ASSEMBLY_ACC=CAM_ASM_000205 /LENGTH=133 /DNA_ID=CAMNT_0025088035 /DNA_START=105 /DNA_END=507 /DNA_ORIENTATION=+
MACSLSPPTDLGRWGRPQRLMGWLASGGPVEVATAELLSTGGRRSNPGPVLEDAGGSTFVEVSTLNLELLEHDEAVIKGRLSCRAIGSPIRPKFGTGFPEHKIAAFSCWHGPSQPDELRIKPEGRLPHRAHMH